MTHDKVGSEAAGRSAESRTLGEMVYAERRRGGVLQRVIATRTGVPQQNISAYERGHVQPSWEMFVRLLAAMRRRPVITIESLDRDADLRDFVGPPERRLELALAEALAIVGDHEYRVEDEVATYLHGGNAPSSPSGSRGTGRWCGSPGTA